MRVPFTLSDESITVFAQGKMYSIRNTHPNFEVLVELLKEDEHDEFIIATLCDVEETVRQSVKGCEDVEVKNGVVYYQGEEVHNSLTDKLLDMLDLGFDVKPWAKFLENLMQNPSYRSREALYDFLEHFNAPITEDGCFLAFKRVRSDFKDIHSGTFDNSPGQVVSMPRHKVDDDNNRTCSAGLHVCAEEYLKGFYGSGIGTRVVVAKVDPKDVVSVPYDYNFSKMRVCHYEVLHEVEQKDVEDYDSMVLYTYDWE